MSEWDRFDAAKAPMADVQLSPENVAERNIRIVHNLIGRPGATIDDITRVYSHPQGLAQCRRFLSEHAGWQPVSFYDTAGAVAHLAREGTMSDATIRIRPKNPDQVRTPLDLQGECLERIIVYYRDTAGHGRDLVSLLLPPVWMRGLRCG